MKFYTLNNGATLPEIGFGTWQLSPNEAYDSVSIALETGYRLIDTAKDYANEDAVGAAIKASKVKREDIILTTKLWNADQGYDNTLRAFETSMKKLDTGYLDLYLIHWPYDKQCFPDADWKKLVRESWKAFERLYDEGSIKGIGVCNFMREHLEFLLSICNIPPVLDQIELHPGHTQELTRNFAEKHKIAVEAWSPLGCGSLINSKELKEMAEKYNTDVASICIAWCKNHNAIVLPRSANPEHIKSNFKEADFKLSEEEMMILDNMEDIGYSGLDPYNLTY